MSVAAIEKARAAAGWKTAGIVRRPTERILSEANAGLEKMLAALIEKGLSPEQAKAVVAKGFATRGSSDGGKVHAEMKRLPDGQFAPKGQGQILRPGMTVHLPGGGGHHMVAATGSTGINGEALGAHQIQVAKPDGSVKTVGLAPGTANLQDAPYSPGPTDAEILKANPTLGDPGIMKGVAAWNQREQTLAKLSPDQLDHVAANHSDPVTREHAAAQKRKPQNPFAPTRPAGPATGTDVEAMLAGAKKPSAKAKAKPKGRAAAAAPGGKANSLSDSERTALADHIESYAEGVEQNLRDDHFGESDQPTDFPVVDDLLTDADRIRAGEDPLNDTLEQVSDMDPKGATPEITSALKKMGHTVGYQGRAAEPAEAPGGKLIAGPFMHKKYANKLHKKFVANAEGSDSPSNLSVQPHPEGGFGVYKHEDPTQAGKDKYLNAKAKFDDAKASGADDAELAKLAKAARKAKLEGKAAGKSAKPKTDAENLADLENAPKEQLDSIIKAPGASAAAKKKAKAVLAKQGGPSAQDKIMKDGLNAAHPGEGFPALKGLLDTSAMDHEADKKGFYDSHDNYAEGKTAAKFGQDVTDSAGTKAIVIKHKPHKGGDTEKDRFTVEFENGTQTTVGYGKIGDVLAGKKKWPAQAMSGDQISSALEKSLAAGKGKPTTLDKKPTGKTPTTLDKTPKGKPTPMKGKSKYTPEQLAIGKKGAEKKAMMDASGLDLPVKSAKADDADAVDWLDANPDALKGEAKGKADEGPFSELSVKPHANGHAIVKSDGSLYAGPFTKKERADELLSKLKGGQATPGDVGHMAADSKGPVLSDEELAQVYNAGSGADVYGELASKLNADDAEIEAVKEKVDAGEPLSDHEEQVAMLAGSGADAVDALGTYFTNKGIDIGSTDEFEDPATPEEPDASATPSPEQAALDAYKAAGGSDPAVLAALQATAGAKPGKGKLDVQSKMTGMKVDSSGKNAGAVTPEDLAADKTGTYTPPGSPDALGVEDAGPTGGDGLKPNTQGVKVEDMTPGQLLTIKDQTFAYHKPVNHPYHILKPVDGGKAKPIHGQYTPPLIGTGAMPAPAEPAAPAGGDLYDTLSKSVAAAKKGEKSGPIGDTIKAHVAAINNNATSPGRGPSGKLRNFKAMNKAKVGGVIEELKQQCGDDEALTAAIDAFNAK